MLCDIKHISPITIKQWESIIKDNKTKNALIKKNKKSKENLEKLLILMKNLILINLVN